MTGDQYQIEAMAYGAKGIARVNGKVIFVRGAVPGDRVTGDLVSDKGRYGELLPRKWQVKSSLRQESPCSYSQSCGGCQWLEVATSQQLMWKEQFLRSALIRIGKVEDQGDIEIWPPTAVGSWRNRIRLRGLPDRSDKMRLGYMARGSNRVGAIQNCIIAAPGIQKFLAAWNLKPPSRSQGFQLEVQEMKSGEVLVTLSKERHSDGKGLGEITSFCRKLPGVAWAGSKVDAKKAAFFCIESHLGIDFYVRPGQFNQVDLAGNRKLRGAVASFAEAVAPKRVLDVYCGSGNLSMALISVHREIIGIESNPASIEAARYTISANGLKGQARYLSGDAPKLLHNFVKSGKTFDLILLDPPREGMGEAFLSVIGLAPRALVLVGCEPNHFARDLGRIIRHGYRLERLVLADFFPGTFHLESIAFLLKT